MSRLHRLHATLIRLTNVSICFVLLLYAVAGSPFNRTKKSHITQQGNGQNGNKRLVAPLPPRTGPGKSPLYSPNALLFNPQSGGTQNVIWTNVIGATVSGNSLTKTAANNWGNAGAVSAQAIASGDGYVEFTASETSTWRMGGLSRGDSDQNYTDIDFAIYPTGTGSGNVIQVYESGVYRGDFGTYATGDRLRVAVESGVVKYSKNGTVIYTSTVAPSFPLLADTSLYSNGSTLTNVIISGNLNSNVQNVAGTLPPLAPNPVYPGNGFANVPSSFTLRWNSGLNAASTTSQATLTYAIYYKSWPIGGTEPASYSLFASGLPCTADSNGLCTMAVSGLGAGNYRYYIVANMDVSSSTGVSNSILTTQSATALFSTSNILTSMIPAPLPPTAVYPHDGLLDAPSSFTLRWTDGLDVSRRSSLWPVTYAIYYKSWPAGGAEPSSYSLFASGLPCEPDSAGACTKPVSNMSVGNYRFYVLANMDVSASTGVANSILSTQGPAAFFTEATQPIPPVRNPPDSNLAGPVNSASVPVPLWKVYRAFFVHLAHLDQLADQNQASGNLDIANGWRTLDQQKAQLSDSETQILKQVAYDCNDQLKTLDATIQAQLTSFRSQYPNGKFLSIPVPPDLSQSFDQKAIIVNSCIDRLKTGLGASFQKLDTYVQANFQVAAQTTAQSAETVAAVAQSAETVAPAIVGSVSMYSFITVNGTQGTIECGADMDSNTAASYGALLTRCDLYNAAGTVFFGSTPICESGQPPFVNRTFCSGFFTLTSGQAYRSLGRHGLRMNLEPPQSSTSECYWADPLHYGIPETIPLPAFDEQGTVFSGRGPNRCWI